MADSGAPNVEPDTPLKYISPQQLNAAIQLPPTPPGEVLPTYNPNAGRQRGAESAKTIEQVLDDLPTATKAETLSDDPREALRKQLAALQGELTVLLEQQESKATGGDAPRDYAFEAQDLALAILLTLSDGSTVLLQFRKVPVVRGGQLTQVGSWRSCWLPKNILANRAKVEEIVAALRATGDYAYGKIKEADAVTAEELGRQIAGLRRTMHQMGTGAVPPSTPPDRHFDDSLRAVPRIAQSPSLPR